MKKKLPESRNYEDGMRLEDFDVSEIEKRVFRSKLVDLAGKLEDFVSRLDQHKKILPNLSRIHNSEIFRIIKENPDEFKVQKEIRKHLINQKIKNKSNLNNFVNIWESPDGFKSGSTIRDTLKKSNTIIVISRSEKELGWLRTIESALFDTISSFINRNFYLISDSRNIPRPKKYDYEDTLSFFESLENIGIEDIDTAHKLTELIEIEIREEWKKLKKIEEQRASKLEQLRSDFEAWCKDNKDSALKKWDYMTEDQIKEYEWNIHFVSNFDKIKNPNDYDEELIEYYENSFES